MLGHEICSRSERLSKFLRYVVHETLAGRGGELKEQVLAAELYGKSIGPDTGDDSTVRVDARRLRDKLREYYAECPHDPVIVSLPKGSYIPLFELNGAAPLPKPVPIVSKPGQPTTRIRWIIIVAAVLVVAALPLAWYELSRRKPQELIVTALTSYPGGENQPSLSPDGNTVSFMWSGSEAMQPQRIWVKAVDGDAHRPLTSGPFPEVSPAWSPDGREIAFVRPGRGVYVVSQLGGPERQVSPTGSIVKWAPDGKAVLIGDRERGKPPGVFEIDLASGQRRTVIQPESGGGVWPFAVSPDGKTVAISLSERPGIGDVYLVPRSGGTPKRLTYAYSTPWSMTWMPDGREIIYSAGHSLWRVSVSNGRVSNLFGLVRRGLDYPSVSSAAPGRPLRLAFATQYVEFALRLIDLKEPLVDGIFQAVKPLADSDSRDWPGHFSPDRKRLTFLSERGGWRPDLWLVNTDDSGLRQLTRFNAAEVDGGTWSPDGKQVALDASVDGNSDIYVMPADGGSWRRFTSEPSVDRRPSWSRDGQWVYFSSNRSGRLEVWRVPAKGGKADQMTRAGGYEPIPGLDGTSLFFLQGGGPDDGFQPGRLMRMPVSGGPEEDVTDRVRFAKWSVTADGIVYLVHEQRYEAIDIYEFATRKVRRLGRIPFRVTSWPEIGHFNVSEDGRFAITSTVERADSNISLVDNFR